MGFMRIFIMHSLKQHDKEYKWHSRGQRFDPAYLHQKDLKSKDFRSFFV